MHWGSWGTLGVDVRRSRVQLLSRKEQVVRLGWGVGEVQRRGDDPGCVGS